MRHSMRLHRSPVARYMEDEPLYGTFTMVIMGITKRRNPATKETDVQLGSRTLGLGKNSKRHNPLLLWLTTRPETERNSEQENEKANESLTPLLVQAWFPRARANVGRRVPEIASRRWRRLTAMLQSADR